MRIKIERNGEFIETNFLEIEIDEGATNFRIDVLSFDGKGQSLEINKVSYHNSRMEIYPAVTNQINIK